jgi:hypothetical protein
VKITRTRFLAPLLVLWFGLGAAVAALAAVPDTPFLQPTPVHYTRHPELSTAVFHKLAVDREGRVYVLTDRGVARLFDGTLALDKSYRPLAGRRALDLTLQEGRLWQLFEDEFLSTEYAGRYVGALPKGVFRRLAVAEDFRALLAGPDRLALFVNDRLVPVPFALSRTEEKLYARGNQFYVLAADQIFRLAADRLEPVHRGEQLTALAFRGEEILVGSRRGYYGVHARTGRLTLPLQQKVPVVEVTALAPTATGVWVGTPRGVYFQATGGGLRYFAGRRWLPEDTVIDLQPDARGHLYVLTPAGVAKIEFVQMTLAAKAAHYERKIRERHIRYGFCAELRLRTPGDPASAEMIDTDNDGTWSSYYLASQAFRYAVTGDETAREHAWQTFETLERLQAIHPLEGFPARTFERTGFKVSDPERWRVAPDPRWEWKGHTSSDEITAHTFAYAVLYETAARTPPEKARIAAAYDRILSHILRHNLYLVDVDGQPTLWGRWHPEYVNRYPPTVVDRRLNSAEIIAFLQFGYHLTGKPAYRDKAFELFQQHGYLANITNSMAHIRATPGVVFRGHDMGDEWNHSDDLLAFVNYWTLYRYAFNDELRRLYAAAIADHWALERVEHNPLWNFIYAMTGAREFDLEGALWTLRHFPLDLVTWTVQNSHRQDLTRLPPNFRNQESQELLPPDERRVMRWNGNPFVLDGGDGGHTELAGDEFLLPYWMGRYLKILE